jgi:AcrR family transcriptional regulator
MEEEARLELLSGDSPTADRRQRKKSRTRLDLVEAAVRLFGERGFAGTTVQDITDAADVSPRTFFRYFASKEDVLFSEHGQSVAELVSQLARCPADEPLLVSVREAILAIARRFETRPDYYLMRGRIMSETPSVAACALHIQQDWIRVIARALGERLGVDTHTDLRPTLIAGAANAAIRSALVVWEASSGRASLQGLVLEAFELLESGFGLTAAEN